MTDAPGPASPLGESNPAGTPSEGATLGSPPPFPVDPAAGAEIPAGTMLGQYRVLRRLGSGGMAVVYEAEDPVIERRVAVKMMPPALTRDASALKRFLLEAKSTGKLNHPNVVAIHQVGVHEGAHYIVMELVEGGSVGDQMRRRGGPLPWPEATRIVADACKGLAAAHKSGLIHRDIKPGNILRTPPDGPAKLADFGLVKVLDGMAPGGRHESITGTGIVVGTPHYMSPEQCRAQELDARSDIYGLGATYFALLAGSSPFAHIANGPQIMFAQCFTPLPDPRKLNPLIPEPVVDLLRRAMAKEPEYRFQSADAFREALEAVLLGTNAEALNRRRLSDPAWTGPAGPDGGRAESVDAGPAFKMAASVAGSGSGTPSPKSPSGGVAGTVAPSANDPSGELFKLKPEEPPASPAAGLLTDDDTDRRKSKPVGAMPAPPAASTPVSAEKKGSRLGPVPPPAPAADPASPTPSPIEPAAQAPVPVDFLALAREPAAWLILLTGLLLLTLLGLAVKKLLGG
jgi:serine/threonine protein kinase